MIFCSLPSFHIRPHQGVCDTPLQFSYDAETTIFSHHHLHYRFTIQDEFTNGEPSSAGCQWLFRNRESWFENRAKYICHLQNEGRFLRKTAIAFAEMKLSLAQTVIATAKMKLSLAQTVIATAKMKLSLAQTSIATAKMKLSHAQTPIATAKTKLSLAQTPIATAITKLSLAQTPIATAITKLSLAQTLIATAKMKLSLQHRCFGHRDGTLYFKENSSPHLR